MSKRRTSRHNKASRPHRGQPKSRLHSLGSKLRKPWLIASSIVAFVLAVINYSQPWIMSYLDGRIFGGISLYLHSEKLERDEPTYIFFTAPPTSREIHALLPVESSVLNTSMQPEKKVTLSIRYPKQSNREMIPEEFIKHSGAMLADDVVHETNSDKKYSLSIYRATFLAADDRIGFPDASFIIPLPPDSNLPDISAPSQGLDVEFTVYSESRKPEEWQVRYRAVEARNVNEMTWWVANSYKPHMARLLRERLGFWRYLYGWATSEETTIYFFSPKFSYLRGLSIYSPTDWPKAYTGFKFSPYERELIFGI